MSAVLNYDRYQIAAIGALLWKWGRVSEMARNRSGYRTGHEGSGLGLPIPNIPSFCVQLSKHINALPDDYSNAVTIWYAWELNPGGGWWSKPEKAMVLGISEHTLRSRVRRAKEMLLVAAPELLNQPLDAA